MTSTVDPPPSSGEPLPGADEPAPSADARASGSDSAGPPAGSGADSAAGGLPGPTNGAASGSDAASRPGASSDAEAPGTGPVPPSRAAAAPSGPADGRKGGAEARLGQVGLPSGGTGDGGGGDGGEAQPRRRRRFARRRKRGGSRARRVLRWALRGVAVVVFLSVAYLTVTFVQVWDASRSDDARPSDAIIVLGAAQYDCRPSPVLRSRLDHALGLYRDDVAPLIVVTGGKRAGDRCTEAEASAQYLMNEGVPDADLLWEVQGRNTWESLAASANFLQSDGVSQVVLVTDSYHALRVRAIADELGFDAAVSPVGAQASTGQLFKETAAVAAGRIVGFRRLVDIDDRLIRPSE